jgi:hypothetical protein
MKRNYFNGRAATGIIVFLVAVVFLFHSGAHASDVDFHIGIGIGLPSPPPPSIRVIAPPQVYLIPQTPVYYAPSYDIPMFLFSGHWYTPSNGYWFRASSYSGPWRYIHHRKVPVVLHTIPSRYYSHKHKDYHEQRFSPPGHQNEYWNKREKVHYKKYYY